MALIVEDGTGLANAQSYASVAELRAHTPYGQYAIPVGATDEQLEAALIRGTAGLDATTYLRLPGWRSTDAQALAWPRSGAWDRDGYPLAGVPNPIRLACMEAALVELSSAGSLLATQERGGQVKREKVGPIEVEYQGYAPAATTYPTVTMILARILKGGQVRTTR